MVLAAITWLEIYCTIFIGEKGLKINRKLYLEELFHNNDFIFIQDNVPFHRRRKVKNILKGRLNSHFVKNVDWPPNYSDCNPLNYFFGDNVKLKKYEGRRCKPFQSIQELKEKIKFWVNALLIFIPSEKLLNNTCHVYAQSLKETLDQLKHCSAKHIQHCPIVIYYLIFLL